MSFHGFLDMGITTVLCTGMYSPLLWVAEESKCRPINIDYTYNPFMGVSVV